MCKYVLISLNVLLEMTLYNNVLLLQLFLQWLAVICP